MKHIIGLFLLLSFTLTIRAQITPDNAPLSKFGLGDMVKGDIVSQLTMGGNMAGYITSNELNFANPASFAFLRMTSFDVGANASFRHMQDEEESIWVRNGYLNHLALGFPLRNPLREQVEQEERNHFWGLGLGLIPYSRMNYNLETFERDPVHGQIQYNYSGNGGIYQLVSGLGFRYRRSAIGLSSHYHFGRLAYNNQSRHTELEFARENRLRDDFSISGFTLRVGLLHDFVLSASEQGRGRRGLSVGVAADLPGTLRTQNNKLYTSFSNAYGTDTILHQTNVRGTLKMPFSVNIGLTFYQTEKFNFSINTKLTSWSDFEDNVRNQDLANTFYVSAGASYTHDFRDFNIYGNRITYRGGLFYGTDPRQIDLNQFREFGIAFGLGLPLKVTQMMPLSYCHIALEGGYRGIDSVLDERFIRIHLGFTLTDNTWFYKQKFN